MTLAGTALQTSFRVLFVYLLSGRLGIRSFAVSCAIGWCAMLLMEGIHYQLVMKKGLKGNPFGEMPQGKGRESAGRRRGSGRLARSRKNM